MKKILIIDDERILSDFMKNILERKGYKVECAYTGKHGLVKVVSFEPDLVILDVDMPVMHGEQVLNILRSSGPTKKIAVLMCTANDHVALVDHAYEVGAKGYIIKPFTVETLVKKVKDIIG